MTANGIIKACNFTEVIDTKNYLKNNGHFKNILNNVGDMLDSRGDAYMGIRKHVCDYHFRWNHPEKSPYVKLFNACQFN